MQQALYAPGARVVIRDCEWIVRRADRSDDGGYILTVDGLSELADGTHYAVESPEHSAQGIALGWEDIQHLTQGKTSFSPESRQNAPSNRSRLSSGRAGKRATGWLVKFLMLTIGVQTLADVFHMKTSESRELQLFTSSYGIAY